MAVTAAPIQSRTRLRPAATRRFGYSVAIGVNALMLWAAYQLLGWGWPPFLTAAFTEVLPILTLSFVASMVVNAAYFWYDAGWFKSLGSVITSFIGVLVAYRVLQVFPFDFSSYDHDWSWLATAALVLAMVGAGIGLLVESIRLISWPFRGRGAAEN